MGILRPIRGRQTLPVLPLTEQECDSVLAQAYVLMQAEQANAVGIENDRKYIIVFDCRGTPYFISRTEHVYYLIEGNETVVAGGQQIDDVLEALTGVIKENQTSLSPDKASPDLLSVELLQSKRRRDIF